MVRLGFRQYEDPPVKLKASHEVYFEHLPGTKLDKKETIGVSTGLEPSKWDYMNQILPSNRNHTSNSHILIYNRVPKCASTTMLALIKLLSARNSFKFVSSQIYWR